MRHLSFSLSIDVSLHISEKLERLLKVAANLAAQRCCQLLQGARCPDRGLAAVEAAVESVAVTGGDRGGVGRRLGVKDVTEGS